MVIFLEMSRKSLKAEKKKNFFKSGNFIAFFNFNCSLFLLNFVVIKQTDLACNFISKTEKHITVDKVDTEAEREQFSFDKVIPVNIHNCAL